MRVLITAGGLAHVGGVQAYIRDLAVWLLRQGHQPVVYGPQHGRAARQLARLTVPVTEDLTTIGVAPDIIHGNNAVVETITALLHFPDTPAIFVCHGWRGDLTGAPRFPRILQYVAVDDTCADRLLFQEGVAAEKVIVLLNAVDLSRFAARTTPLPPQPRRALVFGNGAHAVSHLPIVERACRRAGIDLDVVGEFSGSAVDAPEAILGNYDLVFAKAKCALEAMACGAAVILCEGSAFGGMVSTANVHRLRRLNFGIRSHSELLTVDAVSQAIAGYDPVDAAAVSGLIRSMATSETLHSELLSLYESVIEQHARHPTDWREESRAAAAFLRYSHSASRTTESNLNLVVKAAHRVLGAPVVGPALTRVARWVVNKGKGGGAG